MPARAVQHLDSKAHGAENPRPASDSATRSAVARLAQRYFAEDEARAQGRVIAVGTFPFLANGRALSQGCSAVLGDERGEARKALKRLK